MWHGFQPALLPVFDVPIVIGLALFVFDKAKVVFRLFKKLLLRFNRWLQNSDWQGNTLAFADLGDRVMFHENFQAVLDLN